MKELPKCKPCKLWESYDSIHNSYTLQQIRTWALDKAVKHPRFKKFVTQLKEANTGHDETVESCITWLEKKAQGNFKWALTMPDTLLDEIIGGRE